MFFVRLLLEREEISINSVDKIGRTPLMYAAMYGHADVTEHLLNYPGVDVDAQDMNGKCAVTHAREVWSGDKRRELGKEKIVSMLRSRGIYEANSPFTCFWYPEADMEFLHI